MVEYKEEYDANFWVYQNWNSDSTVHANIHIPWCGNCKDGEGQHNSKKGKSNWTPSSKWIWIPCDNYEKALDVLKKFENEHLGKFSEKEKREKARDCKTCKPGNNPFWYLN